MKFFDETTLIERLLEIRQYGKEKLTVGIHAPRNGDSTEVWNARIRLWKTHLNRFLEIAEEDLAILLGQKTKHY